MIDLSDRQFEGISNLLLAFGPLAIAVYYLTSNHVDITLSDGTLARAAVQSGASTGSIFHFHHRGRWRRKKKRRNRAAGVRRSKVKRKRCWCCKRDLGPQQRYTRFCGRIVVLSILSLLLYPFLWAWTVIGTLWFTSARGCLPEEGQKWGFLIWLLFSYCGLISIACMSLGKWLSRREVHLQRAQQGIPISEHGVLVDMIRVPSWAFEANAGQELRGMAQDTAAYHPGFYLTTTQREAVEALIQELPKFRLKTVPVDCSECPICLEEFGVGNEVRGLPCAHNFHVNCIDQWLRLNVKCPRCRCSVFPNLDLSALNNIGADSGRSSASVVTATRYVRSQPAGQNSFLRLHGLLRPIRTENATVGIDTDIAWEGVESGVSGAADAMVSVPAAELSSIGIDQSHT